MLKLVVLALTLCFAASSDLTGGWIAGSVSEVTELALWATNQMSSMSGFEGEYTIQTPKNVQKQLVNGVNYKFTLDVIHRNDDGKYTFKSCNLYIYDQSWTGTRTFVESPVCFPQQQRQLAGGWTQVTTVTDDILEVAQLSAKAMTTQLGFEGEHNVVKVQNVQRQIVNGVNYKFTIEYLVSNADHTFTLKTCDLHINHQPWNNNKITFLSSPVCRENKAKQMLAGGWTQTNVITDEMMSLASWATSQLSAFTGVDGEHTVMTLRNMSTQIVSGINYKFTLDVLAQDSTGKYFFKSCDLFINYQSWTNSKTFVEQPKCGANPNFQ